MAGLGRRIAAGVGWMLGAKFFERSLGFVSTLVLARLLMPEDFGLVAMATSIWALLEIFTAFGFDMALIRDRGATREHYDTAWTFEVLLGAAIAALLAGLAVPTAAFFGEPRLVAVMLALAAAAAVQGCENIGVVAFRKELDFRREFLFLGLKKLAMVVTTISTALVLRNYWALVAGMLVGRAMGVGLSYALHPFRPRLSLLRARELVGFSKWLLLTNLIGFVRTRFADFVIGRLSGASVLGIYSVGAELARLPTTELVAPINRAVFPAYALIASDLAALRREYLSVLGMIALVGLPAALGIAAVAPVAVATLLGGKWLPAIEVVQVLAVAGALHTLLSNSYSLFIAIDKPWIQAGVGAVHAVLLVLMLPVLGATMGLRGVLVATLVASCVLFPLSFAFVMRELGLAAADLARVLWRPALGSASMYAVVSLHVSALGALADPLALAEAVALGGACYTGAVAALWMASGRCEGAEAAVLSRVGGWLAARRSRSA